MPWPLTWHAVHNSILEKSYLGTPLVYTKVRELTPFTNEASVANFVVKTPTALLTSSYQAISCKGTNTFRTFYGLYASNNKICTDVITER